MTQRSFVPQGRDDILNTAIRRPEHGGRVHAARSGVTISQYYGRASCGSSSSSTSISQQQLVEIIGSLKEEWRNEIIVNLKEEIDVAPCRACRPWIFFINGVLCFLKINGNGMEKEER